MSIRVATFSSSGPFAGRMQILRHIEGPQRWRVHLKVRKGDQVDEHDLAAAAPVNLAQMQQLVIASIDELTGPDAPITGASMDFYVEARRG